MRRNSKSRVDKRTSGYNELKLGSRSRVLQRPIRFLPKKIKGHICFVEHKGSIQKDAGLLQEEVPNMDYRSASRQEKSYILL